jgi:hypothetical protein
MCGRFTKFALGVGLVLSALTLSAIPTSGMPVIDRGVAIAARPESSLETIEQARWVCGSYRGTGGGGHIGAGIGGHATIIMGMAGLGAVGAIEPPSPIVKPVSPVSPQSIAPKTGARLE